MGACTVITFPNPALLNNIRVYMYITYLYNFHVSWSKKYIVIHCEPQKTVKYDDDIQVTHEDVFYSRGLWFTLYPCIPVCQLDKHCSFYRQRTFIVYDNIVSSYSPIVTFFFFYGRTTFLVFIKTIKLIE